MLVPEPEWPALGEPADEAPAAASPAELPPQAGIESRARAAPEPTACSSLSLNAFIPANCSKRRARAKPWLTLEIVGLSKLTCAKLCPDRATWIAGYSQLRDAQGLADHRAAVRHEQQRQGVERERAELPNRERQRITATTQREKHGE